MFLSCRFRLFSSSRSVFFSPCHVDDVKLTGRSAASATLPETRSRFVCAFVGGRARWERWRTGNGRRFCPSSTTGPTASPPAAARSDTRLNHRVRAAAVTLLFAAFHRVHCHSWFNFPILKPQRRRQRGQFE